MVTDNFFSTFFFCDRFFLEDLPNRSFSWFLRASELPNHLLTTAQATSHLQVWRTRKCMELENLESPSWSATQKRALPWKKEESEKSLFVSCDTVKSELFTTLFEGFFLFFSESVCSRTLSGLTKGATDTLHNPLFIFLTVQFLPLFWKFQAFWPFFRSSIFFWFSICKFTIDVRVQCFEHVYRGTELVKTLS